jgi:CRP/FNR family cyclic AMP-dependent transcriptional regulator
MEETIKEIARDLKDDTNLFHLFEESELELIAPYFKRAKFQTGDPVFKEGEEGDYIAFVKSGRVEIKKETEFKGKQIVLAKMGRGSCLGELALFDQQPRSATVEALEDTELLTLDRKSMDKFIEDYPALGIKVLKGLSRVLSLRMRQAADRLVVIF